MTSLNSLNASEWDHEKSLKQDYGSDNFGRLVELVQQYCLYKAEWENYYFI